MQVSRQILSFVTERRETDHPPPVRVAELGMEVVVDDPNLGTLQIYVATGALYDTGIFALLYSAYILVLKR